MASNTLNVPDGVDKTIKTLVTKRSDERLRHELEQGQSVFDSAAINSMPREELIVNVCKLRKFTFVGGPYNESVKSITQGFDPAQVAWSLVDISPAGSATSTPPTSPSRSLPIAPPTESPNMFAAILQTLMHTQKAENDRREADRKA